MADMLFIREKKDRNYSMIDNTILKDDSISWKAKGLFCYILSLPDDWKIYLSELVNHSDDGITTVRNAIKELIDHGYIERQEQRNSGRFEYIYKIIESPREVYRVGKTVCGKTASEKPHAENLTLLNTNIQSTNKLNTNIQSTDEIKTDVSQTKTEEKKEKEPKHKYGEYQHVALKDSEVSKLKTDFGEDKTNQAIKFLDEYIEMKGYKAQSHYLCIRKWVMDAINRKSYGYSKYKNDVQVGKGFDATKPNEEIPF